MSFIYIINCSFYSKSYDLFFPGIVEAMLQFRTIMNSKHGSTCKSHFFGGVVNLEILRSLDVRTRTKKSTSLFALSQPASLIVVCDM